MKQRWNTPGLLTPQLHSQQHPLESVKPSNGCENSAYDSRDLSVCLYLGKVVATVQRTSLLVSDLTKNADIWLKITQSRFRKKAQHCQKQEQQTRVLALREMPGLALDERKSARRTRCSVAQSNSETGTQPREEQKSEAKSLSKVGPYLVRCGQGCSQAQTRACTIRSCGRQEVDVKDQIKHRAAEPLGGSVTAKIPKDFRQ